MWVLDHKDSWTLKKWCFWILWCWRWLESPLDSKEIKPVNHKWNQPWIFIRRTDAEAEAPILWLPDARSRLTGKHPDAGKDWGQEEKGAIEDEIVGWYHWLDHLSLSKLQEIVKDRACSGSWWWTGKPGMLQSMGSQRVGYDWETELTELSLKIWSGLKLYQKFFQHHKRWLSMGQSSEIFSPFPDIFIHLESSPWGNTPPREQLIWGGGGREERSRQNPTPSSPVPLGLRVTYREAGCHSANAGTQSGRKGLWRSSSLCPGW